MNLWLGSSSVEMRFLSRVVLVALLAAVVADGSEAANQTSKAIDDDVHVQGWNSIQGVTSGCAEPPVDIKTKVQF